MSHAENIRRNGNIPSFASTTSNSKWSAWLPSTPSTLATISSNVTRPSPALVPSTPPWSALPHISAIYGSKAASNPLKSSAGIYTHDTVCSESFWECYITNIHTFWVRSIGLTVSISLTVNCHECHQNICTQFIGDGQRGRFKKYRSSLRRISKRHEWLPEQKQMKADSPITINNEWAMVVNNEFGNRSGRIAIAHGGMWQARFCSNSLVKTS